MELQDNLAKRRSELIARCAEQRKSLHLQSERWKHTLSFEEITHNALAQVKRYQPLLIGAAVALVVIKPRRIAAMLHAATAAAGTLRVAMPIVQQIQHRVWQARHPGHVQM